MKLFSDSRRILTENSSAASLTNMTSDNLCRCLYLEPRNTFHVSNFAKIRDLVSVSEIKSGEDKWEWNKEKKPYFI